VTKCAAREFICLESGRSLQGFESADEMQKIALHPATAAKHGTSFRLQRVIKIFCQRLIKQRGTRNTRGVPAKSS